MYSITNRTPVCLLLLLSTTLFPLLTNALYIRQLPSAPNTKSPRAALLDWDDATNLRRDAQPAAVPQPAHVETVAFKDPTDLTKRAPLAQPEAALENAPSGDRTRLSQRDNDDPNSRPPQNSVMDIFNSAVSNSNTNDMLGSNGGTSDLPKRDDNNVQYDYDTGSGGSDSSVDTGSSSSDSSWGSPTGPVNIGHRSITSPNNLPATAARDTQKRDDNSNNNNNNNNIPPAVAAALADVMSPFYDAGSSSSGGTGYTGETPAKVKERSTDDDPSTALSMTTEEQDPGDWKAERVRREEARQHTPAAVYERQLAARAEWERVEKAIARISARRRGKGEMENDAEWERDDGASGEARGGQEGGEKKKEEGEDALTGGEEVWRKDLLKRLAILEGRSEVEE